MREFLISPGFGAGWSSWNSEAKEFLLFDEGLINLAKRNATEEEAGKYIKEKGYKNIYIGGWEDIEVRELGDDMKFIVEEYDGSESIRIKDEEEWF